MVQARTESQFAAGCLMKLAIDFLVELRRLSCLQHNLMWLLRTGPRHRKRDERLDTRITRLSGSEPEDRMLRRRVACFSLAALCYSIVMLGE